MASLIILRLHPVEPVDSTTFTSFLSGLEITAFDLTFNASVGGVMIGSAAGLADPHLGSTTNHNVNINNKALLQRYKDVLIDPSNPPAGKVRVLESLATAVIVVTLPPGHPEYPAADAFDVRLEIKRGATTIISKVVHYNVDVTTVATLPTNQKTYFDMEPSVILALPSSTVGLDPALAFVELPADGRPPHFDGLVKAIDLVLAGDPGGANDKLSKRAALTVAESAHVAREIVWNRLLFPPPVPARPLQDLYTWPAADPNDHTKKDDLDKDRTQFEAEAAGYQAIHDADALRLAGFVFAVSAAVACEVRSKQAARATLEFPVLTGAPPATPAPAARAVLLLNGAWNASFVVPAAYFYVLGALLPPQVSIEQRYDMARLQREARVRGDLEDGLDTITVPAAPLTVAAAPLNIEQAARRLHALGASGGQAPEVGAGAPVTVVVTDWLAHGGPSSDMVAAFWAPETVAQQAGYLRLLLEVITRGHAPLIAALAAAPLSVATVAQLVALLDKQWRDLFLGPPLQVGLLPPFTQPGTPQQRADAFLRQLARFFTVPAAPALTTLPSLDLPPRLARSSGDRFDAFVAAYLVHAGTPYQFGAPVDPTAVQLALADAFPADPQAQEWLAQALSMINDLFDATDLGPGFAELHFSLMEALFARGFTSAGDIAALSPDDFQDALTGTVAYPHAAAIHTAAGPAAPPPAGPFQPVNPDGALTDCLPPPHLSPLGAVQYLAEMLQVSAASTCQQPFARDGGAAAALAQLLASRRGPIGTLHASARNLGTPLPMIDLVNESLEALAAGLPGAVGGAIYDSAADLLAGHALQRGDGAAPAGAPFRHDAQTLFAAVPEHSSPATPLQQSAAYARLAIDFSAPGLPYAQPIDLNRSYLKTLGSSRFAAMRTFRQDITEFVIDPGHEPAGFQRHLWRYPVRFPLALEYLEITPAEYALLYGQDIAGAPAPAVLLLREVFGFASDTPGGKPWQQIVTEVPEFLERSGLAYCEFFELWHSGFVPFVRAGADPAFPPCLPCCPDKLLIAFPAPLDPLLALRKLAVFVRLWRRLQQQRHTRLSFAELRDICEVLGLYDGAAINPAFLAELAALLMLRDMLHLPLHAPAAPAAGATGAARTHLLSLWVRPAGRWRDWALQALFEHLEDYAEAQDAHLRKQPELVKIIEDNLAPLSRLAGFDPARVGDTWDARPTNTLRFVEVLGKIYASQFTVGQVLFLFSSEAHLAGDDPFPLTDRNESIEDPFDLPEERDREQLWALRASLLATAVDDADAAAWSWQAITQSLRDEFGALPAVPGADLLGQIGMHFFPSVLESEGQPVPLAQRQYRVPLAEADTSPLMWNTPPNQPFRYDPVARMLWTALPLQDDKVAQALQEMRLLNATEQAAVRDLYFAPRAELATIALVFEHAGQAIEQLIHEADEAARWRLFQRAFALFYRRCKVIAAHLAAHVSAEAGFEGDDTAALAWKLLRHLHADENFALTPWEDDGGAAPAVTWGPAPHGGAFAALLGLTGTGLLAEFSLAGAPVWREVGAALNPFGALRNQWNTPVPVVVPALGAALTPEQQRLVIVRNGLALRASDGAPLGGAQPFMVSWQGVLLIDEGGAYRFDSGPQADHRPGQRWRLTLRRGQRSWIMLNRGWAGEDAPDFHSGPLTLRRGVYQITLEYEQTEPAFETAEAICRGSTGFQIRYSGPDSGDDAVVIPVSRLYRATKSATLAAGLGLAGAAATYLERYYTSTVRDMRRTYQRAFKALLLAHNFSLSVRTAAGDRQSEIGYLLDHGAAFAGRAYPRTGPAAFGVHRADFNFNLLPVTDPYAPPAPLLDQRQEPSATRQAALFDWWERLWDYTRMRRETGLAPERPAWLLFYEASERQPDDPPQLVRDLGVDVRHAPLVLTYYDTAAAPHRVSTPELEDERWPVRAWQAEKWVRRLQRRFYHSFIGAARPDLWVAEDPAAAIGVPALAGNDNLTAFVRNGYLESGEPRRYADLTELNDALRQRARAALLAYLCRLDRVALPWGGVAVVARDLSDLLLQDVEVGLCQRASRVEEAVAALQRFVQRARLGLEPGFAVTPAFSLLWERSFASFHVWEACARRRAYRENWIGWDDVAAARKHEAFRFLQDELRRATLTVPVPGGLEYWPGARPPAHPGLTLLQSREPAGIRILLPGPLPEGLDLLGTPERDARPAWLAPLFRRRARPRDGDGNNGGGNNDGNNGGNNGNLPVGGNNPAVGRPPVPLRQPASAAPLDVPLEALPLWIQAAIRLGTRFVRVAAAAVPPASTGFAPRRQPHGGTCCVDCGKVHPALIDEYYFWLQDGRCYSADGIVQNADLGATMPEMISDWHRPDKLPGLLAWDSEPIVHLFWCRVHNGEFMQPRRSDEGVSIDRDQLVGDAAAELNFMGRSGDSLRFEVSPALVPIAGYLDPTAAGFRYDLAADAAITLPQVPPPPLPWPGANPGGLAAYPYFAYFEPGAPLLPLSMHAEAVVVAATMRAHCQFEAALKWYELVFNPLSTNTTWAQCAPPANPNPPPGNGRPAPIARAAAARGDVACCPSTPVSDRIARERAITLEYLETLLQWNDALMCRNHPESFQRAAVIVDTMRRTLGAHPLAIEAQDDAAPMPLSAFVPRPPPLNPRLMSLYERVDDRFALIHNCLNGRRRQNGRPNLAMPFFGDNPLRDGWQLTADVCQDDNDWCLSCCSAYRFTFLLQKALELAGEVRGIGAALLSAYEKGDAEYLTQLRATHERQLLHLGLETRQNQWREAEWQVQALGKTKEGAQTRLRYYQALLVGGLNAGEIAFQSLSAVSMASRTGGNVSEAIAQGIGMTPDMWLGIAGIMGTPLQFQQLPIGNKLAAGFATAARIMNALGEIATSGAVLGQAEGGWDRREEEWRHQVEVIGIEIEQIERQILAAERQRAVALRELDSYRRQIEDAVEVQNFLRDKFTSHELYLFLQQETAALHRQGYELALQTARQAQRAFNYERGYSARSFLPQDPWDNLHEALLAGDRLQAAMRQMETAYLNANCREYELTKHVSLRMHFPHAYLHLQTAGYCEIELPEWMFDLDYPGHYMRRIRNVNLTLPCIVGPYTGVHCRLTLLSSQTRVDPRLADPPACCCDDPSCTDGYHARVDDPRIVKAYAATEAIATSTGQNDSGMFELNFRDERYLPFEFCGAMSRWRIELPQENNQWPLDKLSDLVMQVNYTSREGGEPLRRAANRSAQRHLPGAGLRLIDVRYEMSDEWHALCAHAGDGHGELEFRLRREMFPFLAGAGKVRVNRLELFIETDEAIPAAARSVLFVPGGRRPAGDDDCDCRARAIDCVASDDTPTLFHGVLELPPRHVPEDRHGLFGRFTFQHDLARVSRIFVVCGYTAHH